MNEDRRVANLRSWRTLVLQLGLVAATACVPDQQPEQADSDGGEDGLPELAWEGERVSFGTNTVDEVCLGTLVSLDAAIESIEAELELEPSADKIKFYILDDEAFVEKCGSSPVLACVLDGDVVFSSITGFRYRRHELVHARLGQLGIRSIPLFDEGIAAALDQGGGCLASDWCIDANLDALLAETSSVEFFSMGGYTAGADLVHGILSTHGPELLLAFMAELTRGQPPDEVRSLYLEYFGSVLDEDFEAFKRDQHDDYTIAQRGCDSLNDVPPAGLGDGVAVEATMDCDSPLVVNLFSKPGMGMIEWSFPISVDQSGYFELSTPNTSVHVVGCYPPYFNHQDLLDYGPWYYGWLSSFDDEPIKLRHGSYSITWTDEFGSTLDFEMRPPCVFEAQDCGDGEQCTIWNECRPESESPAQLGEPCEQQPGAPLACEAGTRCVGGVCTAECDATQTCASGQTCARFRICGDICDLLTQDCPSGFACVPSDDAELNDLGLGACVAEGAGELLDPCDGNESSCRAGLSCEVTSKCPEGAEWCCAPLCDAATSSADCPEPISHCNALAHGPVGVCIFHYGATTSAGQPKHDNPSRLPDSGHRFFHAGGETDRDGEAGEASASSSVPRACVH